MADEATTNTPAAGTPAAEQPTNTPAASPQTEEQTLLNNERVKALIRSAEDRVRNQMGNEAKKLRGELEAERKKNLSESEIKDLELKEREKTLADRDKALTEKENRWIAMQAIKEAGLDDGSNASLELVNLVMAEDEKGIKERVTALNNLVTRLVKAQVDARFKDAGRTPGVGTDTAANAGGENESIAVRMGKNAAATNQKSRSILDSYIGGK